MDCCQMEEKDLNIIKDQLEHEALLNKKFSQYENSCCDANLKQLCHEAAQTHKQNFTNLQNYLNSH